MSLPCCQFTWSCVELDDRPLSCSSGCSHTVLASLWGWRAIPLVWFSGTRASGRLIRSYSPTKVCSEDHLLARNTPLEIPHIPELFKDISSRKLEKGSPLCVWVCSAYTPRSRSYELLYLLPLLNIFFLNLRRIVKLKSIYLLLNCVFVWRKVS